MNKMKSDDGHTQHRALEHTQRSQLQSTINKKSYSTKGKMVNFFFVNKLEGRYFS